MKLKELGEDFTIPGKYREVEFQGLANHSAQVVPGDLFIANRGLKNDGFQYIQEAIQRGANAAIIETGLSGPTGFPVLNVPNTRLAQGLVAARFYGMPAEKLRVIGVTGTNGKTTVPHLIQHIFNYAGISTGLIGTVHVDNGKEIRLSTRTTPDSIELQQYLAQMVENGAKTVVMEVSSHSLALERVAGIEFDVAVLTNVTHDHFDFHGDYQNYLEAKSLLFQKLQPGNKPNKYAVLNAEEPSSFQIASRCRVPVFFYSLLEQGNSEQFVKQDTQTEQDRFVTIRCNGQRFEFRTRLPGIFNIYNLLAAISVASLEGIPREIIQRAIPDFPGVPGRYQEIKCGQPFRVMVDFAHNPGALESIVKMARENTHGKVLLVFGCEGEKDRLKRPLMGQIAARYVDTPILTADNIYHEDLDRIFQDVLQGLSSAEKKKLRLEPDRRAAIRKAVELAKPGDFLIVAGKGPEEYLVKGAEKIHFNDPEVIQELLGEPDKHPFLDS